ncbi:arsenosugar biosynthesis radical SAM protein ArsS [soil metagenome]
MGTGTIQITRNGRPDVPVLSSGFSKRIGPRGLNAGGVETLQVNVGKLCNQACKHCHVDAGPKRTEIMPRAVVDACLKVLRTYGIPTLDITGGAPELIPDFRYLVEEARSTGSRVIDRHNLTVIFEDGQQDLPEFFATNEVEVICSLPYFQEKQTDAQRGRGVFEKSIDALTRLNSVGYGRDPRLVLNLVHNPVGAFLPPEQSSIEADFKRELADRFGIVFNNLFAITNMPIARYLDWLRRSGNEASYMAKLVNSFNPATLPGLMCRSMISVDWRGRLFDCDFNQMLDIPVAPEDARTIFDFDISVLENRRIEIADHCFGCTAGSGSSCGGAVSV